MEDETNGGKIGGYREFHEWFLRHGGSNEDGRLSKNFNWGDQDWLNSLSESWTPSSDSRMKSAISLSLIKGRKFYVIAGCELTYFCDFLKVNGGIVHHTFEQNSAMDPYSELMNPQCPIWDYKPDHLIISQVQNIRSLLGKNERERGFWSKDEQMTSLKSIANSLEWSISKIREKLDSPIWVFTHPMINSPSHGMFDYRGIDGLGQYEIITHFKLMQYDIARSFPAAYLLDSDLAFERVGKLNEPGSSGQIRPNEAMGGHPTESGGFLIGEYFNFQMAIISKEVQRVKCVVLDCDNTLWDGIIREDGESGISIFRNRLYRLWQLTQRGIILCLCSKNDPEDSEMIMKALSTYLDFDQKIVSKRINWNPKSANISSLAEELNIGTDSIAFFDDSPFERAEVEAILPEVMVYDAAKIEESLDWFNFHSFGDLTQDGSKRTELYKNESVRKEAESESGPDFEDFLISCEFRLEMRVPEPSELARVAELIQRTNQMNATLNRSDLSEIQRLFEDEKVTILISKLGDKFGDYGIIGVIIASTRDSIMSVKELAFSCRAMGRKVEHCLIEELIGLASAEDVTNIEIDVTKTSRNNQIISTLEEIGFLESEVGSDGTATFQLKIDEISGRRFPAWFSLTEGIGDGG